MATASLILISNLFFQITKVFVLLCLNSTDIISRNKYASIISKENWFYLFYKNFKIVYMYQK